MSRKYRLGPWVAAIAGLLLAGCSLVGQPWKKPEPPAPPVVEEAPPPPLPELPLPRAMHRFELTDPDTHVVGEVQLTIASKEDTLPDIARRFNVGYEEIVRANPGVDPWLPGAGRRIVVPTRFVLPNAPHEGVVINLAALRLYYYPEAREGRAAGRLHLSDRHRPGRAGRLRKAPPRSSPARRTRCGGRRRRCARSTPTTTIRSRPWCPRDPTIRWASTSSRLAGRAT